MDDVGAEFEGAGDVRKIGDRKSGGTVRADGGLLKVGRLRGANRAVAVVV